MLKYQIGLINYNFDIEKRNVRLFSSKNERNEWFEKQITNWSNLVNVNFDNLITTTQNYHYKESENILDLLNKNYCVIKETTTNNYLFFDITSSKLLGGKIIELYLTIDDIMTYWYDLKFSDCLISRAHLNRFKKVDENNVKFDNGKNSLLLSQELENFSKYLLSRQPIYPEFDLNSNSPINKLLKTQQIVWLIVFMKKADISTPSKLTQMKLKPNFIDNGCYVFVAPYYLDNRTIARRFYYRYKLDNKITEKLWDAQILVEGVMKRRADVFNIKISPIPPLDVIEYREGFDYIDNGDDKIIFDFSNSPLPYPLFLPSTKQWGLILREDSVDEMVVGLTIQSNLTPRINYTIPYNNQFPTLTVIKDSNNLIYNPKMLSSNFVELKLTDFTGEAYMYDIQKLNTSIISVFYREGMNVDVTKIYSRIVNLKDSVYEKSVDNYLGLVSSTDTSIPYAELQIDSFLAQNKNFQSIRFLNILTTLLPLILTKSNPALAVASTLGNLTANQLTQNLSLDNMIASPPNINNANGSVLFNNMVPLNTALSMYIDIYKATDIDLKKAHDYLTKNGYSYGLWDNIDNHIRTRKYYNYLECEVDNITGNVSNDIKTRIKPRLKLGIRFWHIDKIDYSLPNYERWLENGNIQNKKV